jgi:hypothetical protein
MEINIEDKVKELKEVCTIFNNIHCNDEKMDKKKKILIKIFINEFNIFINKMEDLFYKKHLKNGSVNDFTEDENNLFNYYKMIETFTPYMLMYQIQQNT